MITLALTVKELPMKIRTQLKLLSMMLFSVMINPAFADNNAESKQLQRSEYWQDMTPE
jgi:hypothetical protein